MKIRILEDLKFFCEA